jgi:acetolactate synthase I/II/III large subunit
MATVGEYLVRLLECYGIDTIFGIPGVHTAELYRGLAHRDAGASRIRHVTPRHEQGAGFMADGYARACGRPAACFVITGPGLTNVLTAMGQAYADSIPMLVISSVNRRGAMGSGNGHLHELSDQRRMASAVSAFSHTITDPAELPQVMARAFAVFAAARPRPVHIELPLDLIVAPADGLALPDAPPRFGRPVACPDGIALAAAWLAAARSPLIFAGGGALAAAESVRRLAERLDAPVVMTINARGLLPPEHPLAVSVSPSFPAVRALAAGADVVLAAGTELGPTDYDMYATGAMPRPRRLIRLDIDPEQAMRGFVPDLALIGDAALGLAALSECLAGERASNAGAERATRTQSAGIAELDAGTRRDIAILTELRDALPEAIVVGDSTRQVYAGNLGFAARAPRRWFNAATGFGALGYGLPAAIGAALADPARPVVCLAGDGGLQFTLAELGAAVEAGVRVIVLLLNNDGYGEIKLFMRQRGIAPLGVDLFTPDFMAVARGFGWHAERLDDIAGLASALRAAAVRPGPSLLEWRD